MAKLNTLTLRVADPQAQRQFYCDVLGMWDRGEGQVGYFPHEAAIRFVKSDTLDRTNLSGVFWKIALSVPNIELAYEQLTAAGVPCTAPHQFRDIGFLAHATDPAGFTVELIDHWFKGDRPDMQHNARLLGGGAHLSLVTLRATSIAAVEPAILSLGMTPLSVQPVEPYGFTLYFYAFTEERPPSPSLESVENRPWLYQRPYTILEIQHIHPPNAARSSAQSTTGYGGLTISSENTDACCERLGITAAK